MAGSFLSNLAAEWVRDGYAPYLFAGLILAGIGTLSLFCLGLLTYYRRRSREYLLLTLALGALVVRTMMGLGTAVGVVPMTLHHFLDHGLDFVVAGIVLYTVYRSRSKTSPAVHGDEQYRSHEDG